MSASLHSKPMATRSGPSRSPHPKTSLTPLITPQRARPAPAWAYHISEVHLKNWTEFSKIMELGLTTSPSTPCPPSWSTPKTRHKKCGVIYEIQCQETGRIYPGDKDERPPKTEVPTNSCGRPWTSHQNGQCQSDSLRRQHVATQDPWVHRNQDPLPGNQPRPGIWAPPHLWRTAVMWPLFWRSRDLGGLT